jgi:hypothetical protein
VAVYCGDALYGIGEVRFSRVELSEGKVSWSDVTHGNGKVKLCDVW